MKMIVKPTVTPVLGVAHTPNDKVTWSLAYKAARDARLASHFDAYIEAGVVVPFVFNASGSIFYDPETWSLGYSSIGECWHFI